MKPVQKENGMLTGVRVVESVATVASALDGMLLSDLGVGALKVALYDANVFLHRWNAPVFKGKRSARNHQYGEMGVLLSGEQVTVSC